MKQSVAGLVFLHTFPSLVYTTHVFLLSVSTMLPLVTITTGYHQVDTRCSCKCPEAETLDPPINIDWPGRKIYINSTVSPTDCDCEHVVQPVLVLTQEQVSHN